MSARRFGCEFEFSAAWKKVEDAARASIPPRELHVDKMWFRSKANSRWVLKTDSTTNAELTTPVCHEESLGYVCEIARRLSKFSLYITSKDGFHVHVSAGRNSPLRVARAWMDYEESILSMFPAHRRNNDLYCKRYVEHGYWLDKDSTLSVALHDHHSVFSLSKLRTFEFRIGEGTINPRWVGAWVRFCLSFIDSCSEYRPRNEPRPLEELLKRMCVKHEDYRLFMKRREQFGGGRV